MVVCSFYQKGTCNKGQNCRFEHPSNDRSQTSQTGFGGNTNRFAPLSGGDRYRPGQQQQQSAFGGGRDAKAGPRFHLSKDEIKADLTDQRPVYPLSCFGPGRDAPRQLIEGPVEVSPEELRDQYYRQRLAGNEGGAQRQELELHQKMQQQVDSILKDLDGAIRYVEEGANTPGDRRGMTPAKSQAASTSNPFSQPPANPLGGSQAQTPAFGQPSNSAFSQPRLAPAFGQASNPGQSTTPFGQPSALGGQGAFGKPSMPGAFGQPSSLGGATGFGKPSALGGAPGFGQPSALGGPSAFGQPSALGGASAFGKPAFGQASAPGAASAFGKPSVPGTTSGFGQPNALGQATGFGKPAFGQSAFGQPAQPGASASPFSNPAQAGQPSPFARQGQTAQPTPFGGQAQNPAQPSVFGQPSQAAQTPAFATPTNPFGSSQQPPKQTSTNPFASPGAATTPAFGQTGFNKPALSPFAAAPAQAANPFGPKLQSPASAPSPFTAQVQSPKPVAQTQQPASPFQQAHQSGTAPMSDKPVDPKDRFKEGKPGDYEGEQGRILEDIYRRVGQLGRFNDDEDIPLIPPKCEWIVPIQAL
ncbi:hypothetical protein K504DRAFT_369296 [Pleomassaria siparia CBS 279.74]|uniref:C3H1-type domain-containing protein n=1 Tax=Pleomassaria siparia CBS 279.74 TaxID=1314801 RepID=A0A6G1KNF0_9PLEO|nr:hypothetical protein K504DRAFT_369296 [Pleomassaria siparia CBS 279.74]